MVKPYILLTMDKTEARLQQNCYMWFHNSYPNLRGLFFRIKNEGTNAISGARDKSLGVIAGVSDVCLLVNKTAVFIEFKTPIGRQSLSQKIWETKVKSEGYQYFIIRSETEFKELCQKLGL